MCVIIILFSLITVEPRLNEPLYYNEQFILYYNEQFSSARPKLQLHGTEPQYNKPRFNEILVITSTIQKHKHKVYLV